MDFFTDFFTHERIAYFVYLTIVFLSSAAIHEFCHAIVATWCGDDTPRLDGRLTLNPMAHFDFWGFILIFLIGIGWAKPVRINPYIFRNPRLDHVLVSIAGPLSNLFLAFVMVLLFRYGSIDFISYEPLKITLQELSQIFFEMNVILFVFNLLPIPGFDGFSLVLALAPARWDYFLLMISHYSILLALLLWHIPGFEAFFYNVIAIVKMLLLSVVF